MIKLNLKRKYFFMEELSIMDYVMDLRFSRQGWKCWACNKPTKAGKLIGWAVKRGNYPPDVVFWDSIACKQLLERKKVI